MKKNLRTIMAHLLTLQLLLLSGCGFVDDKPVESELYDAGNIGSDSCELNTDELSQIFEQNIDEQIDCLRKNFLLFSRFVRTNSNDWIEEDELRRFVLKHFQNNADTIIKGLQVIFELNMLLLRDERDRISRDNIDPIFRLLVGLNRQAAIITNGLNTLIKGTDEKSYWEVRAKVEKALKDLARDTFHIVSRTNRLPQNLNLKDFLLNLGTRFDIEDFKIDEELVESILFIKQIFIGGKREFVSSDEFTIFLDKLPKIVISAIDLIFLRPENFSGGENEIYTYYQRQLEHLEVLFAKLPEDTKMFTRNNLISIIEQVTTDDFDVNDYLAIIDSYKKNLIGGDPEVYVFRETKLSMLYFRMGLDAIAAFQSYDRIKDEIDALPTGSDLQEKEREFIQALTLLSNRLSEKLRKTKYFPGKINLGAFVKILPEQFDDLPIDVAQIEVLLGLKTSLVGGDRMEMSATELIALLEKIKDLGPELFSLIFKLERTQTDQERLNLISDVFDKLSVSILPQQNEERIFLFKTAEMKVAIRSFLEEDQIKYLKLIDYAEDYFIRNVPGEIDLRELKDIFSAGQAAISLGDFRDKRELLLNRRNEMTMAELKVQHKLLIVQTVRDLEKVIKENQFPEEPIIWRELFIETAKLFEFEIDIKLFDYIEPFKAAVLGGKTETLSNTDLLRILELLPEFSDEWVTYEVEKGDLPESFFIKGIQKILKFLPPIPDKTIVFNSDQLVELAADFVEDLPLKDFSPSLKIAKAKIIGGDQNQWNFSEFKYVLNIILEFFERQSFNRIAYGLYQDEMSSRNLIPSLPFIEDAKYSHLTKENLRKYHSAFVDVVSKHRYFRKESDGQQYIAHQIRRNSFGTNELAILKWGISFLIKGWGHADATSSIGYSVSVKELEKALIDFRPILEHFKLWSANFETFARNTLLLGDLFQANSNGSGNLDLDETTEYGTLVLSAVNLAEDLQKKMAEHCPNMARPMDDDEYLFMPACYRKHYFRVMMEELGYKKNYPVLQNYFNNSTPEEQLEYLINVEGFARDIVDDDIPLGQRDFTLLTGAFLNIETTFMRFDRNRDNLVTTDELDSAFKIYEDALIAIAELEGDSTKYARAIFIYMVKNMEIPGTVAVLWYHNGPDWVRNVEAKRLNIGALLYYLVNQ